MIVLKGSHLRATELDEMAGAWMNCSRCGGCGMVQSWEVKDCPECGGSGLEVARDSRGRFTNIILTDKFNSAKI